MRRTALGFAFCSFLGCDPRLLDVVGEGPARDAAADASAQDAEITRDAGDASASNDEVCDGVDQDRNGQVDDLDVASDGLCDCLRIAAFGEASIPSDRHVFARWIVPRLSATPRRLGSAALEAETLANLDVLVVEDLSVLGRVFAGAEATALDTWLRAGGGLLALAGFGTSSDAVNLLLAPYGLGFNPPDPLVPSGTERLVDDWATHPISTGLTTVAVVDGQPTRGLGARLASASGSEVARVLEVDAGRILLWGDDSITDAQAWETRDDLDTAQLWAQALRWLTPGGRCLSPAR